MVDGGRHVFMVGPRFLVASESHFPGAGTVDVM